MPYNWTQPDPDRPPAELQLWPHQSLPPRGFVWFIGSTAALITVPLIPLLGSVIFFGILPFLMLAVGGVWFGLTRSWRSRQILEILTLTEDRAHLIRHNPRGDTQEWHCNRYWAVPELHKTEGPVPNYVTLRGEGREVEIGAFLSEDERIALFAELQTRLRA
ncbi:MAG: DUF2244 domain-containing protein [Rhodobacteraceae bacterium]|nr:DUF2244 domain-containing protein [Paracoccaceae bacterium]